MEAQLHWARPFYGENSVEIFASEFDSETSNQSQRTALLLIGNFEIHQNGANVVEPDRQEWRSQADDQEDSPTIQTVTA